MSAFLAGCGDLPPVRLQLGAGDRPAQYTQAGLIAADEPEAVLAARDVLMAGGSAADAAAALGLVLTVTLPSRAGLGGGGACVHFDARAAKAEVLDFMAPAAADDVGARFLAAVPAASRGLFALHARYGVMPWPQVVAPAENLARFGHRVSRAFALDLKEYSGALVNDRTALAAFMTPRRQMLQAGDVLRQVDLATMLGRLRARGPGDFYAGTLARDVEDAIAVSGGAVTAADLRAFVPQWRAAIGVDEGSARLFTPSRSITGGDFGAGEIKPGAAEKAPGATGFVVADSHGNAVACVLTMRQIFGLGIMPMGSGFLLAPGPQVAPQHIVPVIGISPTDHHMIYAAAVGGPNALAQAAIAVRTKQAPADGAGLVNMLVCGGGENATSSRCQAVNDPRGAGYALMLAPKE